MDTMLALLGLGGGEIVIIFAVACGLLFGVAGTVFWIWALIDCATKEPNQGNEKIVWILVIVFTHWIGALIYLLVRRPKRIEQYGK